MKTKIAKATPFAGQPCLHIPSVFGGCTGKELRYRIPVTGARPISIRITGLPAGLLQQGDQIVGKIDGEGEYPITICAENSLGKTEKQMTLSIHEDNLLRTPLLGFTSWNACRDRVSQESMLDTARKMQQTGLADYGYNYLNIDSGWQGAYGGEYDAILPNEKFPDMKGMCDTLHEMGFLCGIYSTPYRYAWGAPNGEAIYPGCTTGDHDPLQISFDGCPGQSIGKIHKEENNARQWDAWGFDYLKYDWNLTDPTNADYMKQALRKLSRAMAFCCTVNCSIHYGAYWSANCCSWRDNQDSGDNWDGIVKLAKTVSPSWKKFVRPGHFYDLDMLELSGMEENNGVSRLNFEEELFAYTLRAFFASPIQLSCKIETITDEEMDIFCNDEILAINQDALADFPLLLQEEADGALTVYHRRLEKDDQAIAAFNVSDQPCTVTVPFDQSYRFRDVWAKEDLPCGDRLTFTVQPHSTRVFRFSK